MARMKCQETGGTSPVWVLYTLITAQVKTQRGETVNTRRQFHAQAWRERTGLYVCVCVCHE